MSDGGPTKPEAARAIYGDVKDAGIEELAMIQLNIVTLTALSRFRRRLGTGVENGRTYKGNLGIAEPLYQLLRRRGFEATPTRHGEYIVEASLVVRSYDLNLTPLDG